MRGSFAPPPESPQQLPYHGSRGVAHGGIQVLPRPPVAPEGGAVSEAAAMMVVSRRLIPSNEVRFCADCGAPFNIRVRLESCHHVLCLDCCLAAYRRGDEKNAKFPCPSCGQVTDKRRELMVLHPEERLLRCPGSSALQPRQQATAKNSSCSWAHSVDGRVNSDNITGEGSGRAFLNTRSLNCHAMFFHPLEEEEAGSGVREDNASSSFIQEPQPTDSLPVQMHQQLVSEPRPPMYQGYGPSSGVASSLTPSQLDAPMPLHLQQQQQQQQIPPPPPPPITDYGLMHAPTGGGGGILRGLLENQAAAAHDELEALIDPRGL